METLRIHHEQSKKILVIATHPDDETMGCGGTLLKHRAAGDRLFWLIVTRAFEPFWSAEIIRVKSAEVDAVAAGYPIEKVFWLGLPTTRLDTLPQADIMSAIRQVMLEVQPDWVYVNNRSDVHSDHRAVFEASMAVLKPFHPGNSVSKILGYETLSSTDAAAPLAERMFIPMVYSDISRYLEHKLEIMAIYQTEQQSDPFPRGFSAIRALARYRGATVGLEYAEAFMLLREIY